MTYFNERFKGAIIDKDSRAVVDCIAEYGANVADENGITPLHFAVLGHRVEITALLLDNGANVEAADMHGQRPFDLRKPVVNSREQHRITAHQAASMGNLEQTRAFIALGGDLHQLDHANNTVLQHAARNGHADVVQELIDAGADINRTHRSTTPAVHLAAQSGSVDTLSVLLNSGADPTVVDPLHRTAIHTAASSGSVECLALLIDRCDPNALNILKETALDIAQAGGHEDASRWLVEQGGKNAPEIKLQDLGDVEAEAYKRRLLASASTQYEVGRGDTPPRMRFQRM
ncbi:TPA: ankyrin repeat domain-containing protein [Stenotrophomonas maltophilia]|uniref:ankyrin repeat domain-containing protein n=1 Tax=Stenotrophomonas sp. GD03654 TaxID=2975362 RepID=UPI002447BAD7|nr:ankyrin repeat domain-containing protein [Stenotrophomonas sp. GD03654]HDS1366952.1 ankyrin repeat domain-containing protein [Stenotrophomonas maltophilia]MDH2177886.1 ankyrin repeat domain-containing protein [Stenotrophomonas sp. GD03654]HDS1371756.1 ankyrin repeat domain-containing protein [Stenotrophomonas maltophilia]HDS1376352.1 ankyrin repeat domain-containing protein [Stenotrophomonas maltophilia]HDS1381206.1 ankyrin repeat domain-containing protein [Stenotrophomonas maltophilia]